MPVEKISRVVLEVANKGNNMSNNSRNILLEALEDRLEKAADPNWIGRISFYEEGEEVAEELKSPYS